MEQPTPHWTSDEFLAYTLLYSAHADYFFDDEEKELIVAKINLDAYQNVFKELAKDNDYQSLQKILAFTQEHKYNENEINVLLHEIELLFMCDGKYDILEKNMMMSLVHLLKYQNDVELSH